MNKLNLETSVTLLQAAEGMEPLMVRAVDAATRRSRELAG